MSLAQAVLEHCVGATKCLTFFATHYHELTDLGRTNARILNAHMAIEEHKGELVFLRKLREGPANRSYGIEVARLAGIPKSVTSRAQVLLKGLTHKSREIHENQQLSLLAADVVDSSEPDAKLYAQIEDLNERLAHLQLLADQLEKTDVNHITPLESLTKLAALKEHLRGPNL
jgi:DNA mismatch repair protein MutS